MHTVFYHPKEEDFVCLLGQNVFKCYKLSQDNIKPRDSPFAKAAKSQLADLQYSTNFLSHTLLKDDVLLVGTDQGEILLFNSNCEFKMVVSTSPFESFPITCFVQYSKGFLVGGANCTCFIFERHEGDAKNPYIRLDKKYHYKKSKDTVVNMLMTNGDENLVLGLEDNTLVQIPFSVDRGNAEDKVEFQAVVQHFHSAKITGLDVCMRKSLLATCSLDKSVRVWNYLEHTLECEKVFDEEALSLAFHPSGL